MDRQTVVHPDNETLFRAKKITLLGQEKTWRILKHVLLSERSQSEKAAYLHDSNYMTFWKSWNNRHNKKLLVARGSRGKG